MFFTLDKYSKCAQLFQKEEDGHILFATLSDFFLFGFINVHVIISTSL